MNHAQQTFILFVQYWEKRKTLKQQGITNFIEWGLFNPTPDQKTEQTLGLFEEVCPNDVPAMLALNWDDALCLITLTVSHS